MATAREECAVAEAGSLESDAAAKEAAKDVAKERGRLRNLKAAHDQETQSLREALETAAADSKAAKSAAAVERARAVAKVRSTCSPVCRTRKKLRICN